MLCLTEGDANGAIGEGVAVQIHCREGDDLCAKAHQFLSNDTSKGLLKQLLSPGHADARYARVGGDGVAGNRVKSPSFSWKGRRSIIKVQAKEKFKPYLLN